MKKIAILSTIVTLGAGANFAEAFNIVAGSPSWAFQLFAPQPSNINSYRSAANSGATGNYNPGTGLDPLSDCLFQSWYWARGNGESREYAIAGYDFPTEVQETATRWRLGYQESVNGIGNVLRYEFRYELFPISATQSYVKVDWSCKNLQAPTQTVNFFIYQDLQTGTSAANVASYDSATNTMSTKDFANASKPTIYVRSITTPVSWMMDSATEVRNNRLSDNGLTSSLTNVATTNVTDIAGAFQYTFSIAQNATASGTYLIGYNYLPPTTASVGGTVAIQPILDTAGRSLTVELRDNTTLAVLETYAATLDASGNFTFNTTRRGTYNLAVKGAPFTRATVSNVNITDAGVSGLNFTVLNGDIDGDNSITIIDYSVLSDYFDRDKANDLFWDGIGSNGFRPRDADIDFDDAVTILDYSILSENFDLNGAD